MMFPLSLTYKPSRNCSQDVSHHQPKSPTHPLQASLFQQSLSLLIPRYHERKGCSHLPNILIPHPTNLLQIRRALAYALEAVPGQLQLVLYVLGGLDVDAWLHCYAADDLFA
jgi:hypothetical protein